METNNDLLKLSEKMGLRGLEDECIVLEDERADDIYGGKFVCGSYNKLFIWQLCLKWYISMFLRVGLLDIKSQLSFFTNE